MDLEWFRNYNPKCEILKNNENQEHYAILKKMCNQMPREIMYYIGGRTLNYKFREKSRQFKSCIPHAYASYIHIIPFPSFQTFQRTKINTYQYFPFISQLRVSSRGIIIWINYNWYISYHIWYIWNTELNELENYLI